MNNKDEPSNYISIKKTYIHVTTNHIGDAAVVLYKSNLWVKNTKYKKMSHSMQRRTGEAWTEVKTVNAMRAIKLERKCIFVGVE